MAEQASRAQKRLMGTSVLMIERYYGALLDGAHAAIAGRLAALEAELEETAKQDLADETRLDV